jgi:hypothetical protein
LRGKISITTNLYLRQDLQGKRRKVRREQQVRERIAMEYCVLMEKVKLGLEKNKHLIS